MPKAFALWYSTMTLKVGPWNPKDLIARFQPDGGDPLPEFGARERLDEMGIRELEHFS
jgi:hypothetical protein